MMPVKVQCACGQRYAFDVEPVNGVMLSPVACPACGADGTGAANDFIARTVAEYMASAPVPVGAVAPASVAAVAPSATAAPASAGGLRVRAPAAAPPPPPILSSQSAPRPVPQYVAAAQKRGKDGWATEETQLNKLGTWIIVTPTILAGLISWGIIGVEVPIKTLFIVVGIAGILGGALNIAGRGPIIAGAFIGLLIAIGGYGAVCWWLQGRESVHKFELIIAFAVGAAPGFGFQYLLQ
jgi:hypothetical protein